MIKRKDLRGIIKCFGLQKAEIDRFFYKLDRTYFKVWRREIKKSLMSISRRVKKTVPVSKRLTERQIKKGRRSGDFRRSIKWELGRKFLGGWIFSAHSGDPTRRGYIGHLLEYGTRSKKQKEGKYFHPAREAEMPVLLRNLKAASAAIKSGKDLK